MSNAKTTALVSLIQSMAKSEKRHFKLYSNRLPGSKDAIYIKIFDLLESSPLKDDDLIKRKLKLKNTAQFVNSKRHLYNQILKSLRLLYAQKHAQIGINEEIDYATILAHKHLYQDSYIYLDRLDIPSNEYYTQNLLNITEIKRRLASHLDLTQINFDNVISETRAQLEIDWKIDDLYNELKKDFSLLGYTRNDRENTLRHERFQSKINSFQYRRLSSLQQFNYHELNILFYRNTWNYRGMYKNAYHQYELLATIPYHKNEDHYIKLFIQSLSTILNTCYLHKNKSKYNYWYSILINKISDYNTTREKHGSALVEVPEYINLYSSILNCRYSININVNRDISNDVDHEYNLLKSRYLAYQGLYEDAIEIINKVLNAGNISTEISLYARLHQVLFHYRLNNFELVKNLLPALRLAFKTAGHFNKTINSVLTFTGKGVKALNFGMKDEINDLQIKLKVYSKTPYENIPFLYFDFYNWFECIKLNINVSDLKR